MAHLAWRGAAILTGVSPQEHLEALPYSVVGLIPRRSGASSLRDRGAPGHCSPLCEASTRYSNGDYECAWSEAPALTTRSDCCLPQHRSTNEGFDFVCLGIASAVSGNIGRAAEEYAKNRWGSISRAVTITKAAVAAVNTQGGAGDQMISDERPSAEFFDLVRARSIIGRLPLRRVPFRMRTLSMYEGPRGVA